MLVADDGSVLGRFNLYDLEDGTARLGYRVAQQVAGRGVATTTVRELCRIAAARHGTHRLGYQAETAAKTKIRHLPHAARRALRSVLLMQDRSRG